MALCGQEMSSEVVDSNPYSRLMALKRMGIVNNYERIRDFSVAIVVTAFESPSDTSCVWLSLQQEWM
jgi:hypothetical protein